MVNKDFHMPQVPHLWGPALWKEKKSSIFLNFKAVDFLECVGIKGDACRLCQFERNVHFDWPVHFLTIIKYHFVGPLGLLISSLCLSSHHTV